MGAHRSEGGRDWPELDGPEQPEQNPVRTEPQERTVSLVLARDWSGDCILLLWLIYCVPVIITVTSAWF